MVYSNHAGHASEASLHGAPPPSYRSRSNNDGEARSRPARSRRPSESNGSRRPAYQRTRSGDDVRQPPMPASTSRSEAGTRQPSYGSREDQNASYGTNNQRSTALNSRQAYDNFDQEPAQRGRKDSSNGQNMNDMYEIPTLPKESRQRKHYPDPPQSPPYSAVAPGSSGPSPGQPGNASGTHVTSDAPDIDMNAFFEELDSVRESMREMEQYITYIDQLHSRNMSGTAGDELAVELEQANDGMRKLTNNLRKRVKALQETTRIRTHGQAEQDRLVRKTQTEGLKNKYVHFTEDGRP